MGQVDDWTFFGRAGQTVAIFLQTGSAGTPPPPAPTLNHAQLTLIDPNSTVLATASTSFLGADVNLAPELLLVDGVYHVHVEAPASQPSSTGNYVVAVWDASIQDRALPMDQMVTDQLDTTYQFDRWTFTSVTGQQVQFDLRNASTAAIRFDLTGPGGDVFVNQSADTGLLSLPGAGTYTLTAYATQGEMGSYAFQMNLTPLADLELGTPTVGTLTGSRQPLLYRVTLNEASPLLIALDDHQRRRPQ